jgi:hypothetical protein
MSEMKKVCQHCSHWQAGEVATSAGRVILMSCRQPLSESFMRVTSPSMTCDKFTQARKSA